MRLPGFVGALQDRTEQECRVALAEKAEVFGSTLAVLAHVLLALEVMRHLAPTVLTDIARLA